MLLGTDLPFIGLLCREEAQQDAASEPLLSSFLYASILGHDSFEKALAFVLANRLANTTLLPTQLFEIFVEVGAYVLCNVCMVWVACCCSHLCMRHMQKSSFNCLQVGHVHGTWCLCALEQSLLC